MKYERTSDGGRAHMDALSFPVGAEERWRHMHLENLQLPAFGIRGVIQDLQIPDADLVLQA